MKKLIYIIIVIAIALTACEKTLDFPFEYKKPKLVLNCLLSNTSEIDFSVSRSMHILDSKEIVKISDADVIIFEDDKPLQVVPVSDGEGNYHVAYIPKVGHTYRFQVSKDGFETIESEVTIPNPTTINNLSGKYKNGNDPDVYYYGGDFDIDINFNDNTNEENYYMISVTAVLPDDLVEYLSNNYSNTYYYDMLDSNYKLNLECNDMSVNTSSNITLLYLSDEIIGSGNYTMKFTAHDYRDIYGVFYEIIYSDDIYEENEEEGDEEEDPDNDIEEQPFYREYEYRLVVHLQSTSKEYYQYMKSFDQYVENDGNPFAEPTLVKTNIKNGLGILGASGEITDTLRFTIKNPYLNEEEE